MADTKAKPVVKAERKKPVRKSPVQKDYPTKLAWLQATLEFEQAEEIKANAGKVARLDKRIADKQATVDELVAVIAKLKAQRAELVPAEATEDEGFDEFEIANGRDES